MVLWYGKLFYGAGSLSYGVVSQTMLGLMMLFATDAHAIPAWLAGISMAAGFAVSAFADPVVSYLSGRTRSVMFGKRFAYIIAGIFLTAFFNVILWTVPVSIGAGLKFLWLTAFTLLINVFLSALSVPHGALGAELAGDSREYGVISNYRKIFTLAALAVPTLLLGILIRDTKDASGYVNLAIVNSCIVIISGLLMLFSTYAHLPRLNAKYAQKPAPKMTGKEIFGKFFGALKERNCRNIILGYTASMMSLAFLTSAGLLFLRHTMGFSTGAMAGILSVLFLFVIASQPLWERLAKKSDKKQLVLAGTITALTGILVICVLFVVYHYAGAPGNPLYLFIAAMAVVGAGSGAMHAVPALMLSSLSAEKRKKGDHSQPGHNAFMSFMFKAAQGFVMLLAGALISAFGFSGAAAAQAPLAAGALGWIVILGSSLSLGAAVYFYISAGRPGRAEKAGQNVNTGAGAEAGKGAAGAAGGADAAETADIINAGENGNGEENTDED